MPTHPPDNRLLVLDVDGVLTDGSIMLDDQGIETKRFNVRDGLGITTWLRLGLDAALVTKRSGKALQHRAAELGVRHVIQGSPDKAHALADLELETTITPRHMAYIGDDWPDMSAMRVAGYPIAVADATPDVRALARYTTTLAGGHGAVREAIEHLLREGGNWDRAMALFV